MGSQTTVTGDICALSHVRCKSLLTEVTAGIERGEKMPPKERESHVKLYCQTPDGRRAEIVNLPMTEITAQIGHETILDDMNWSFTFEVSDDMMEALTTTTKGLEKVLEKIKEALEEYVNGVKQ